MTCTKLSEYRNKETIDLLNTLLKEAQRGRIQGVIFCTRHSDRLYSVGSTGVFRDDPLVAVAAAGRLQHLFNVAVDNQEKAANHTRAQ